MVSRASRRGDVPSPASTTPAHATSDIGYTSLNPTDANSKTGGGDHNAHSKTLLYDHPFVFLILIFGEHLAHSPAYFFRWCGKHDTLMFC